MQTTSRSCRGKKFHKCIKSKKKLKGYFETQQPPDFLELIQKIRGFFCGGSGLDLILRILAGRRNGRAAAVEVLGRAVARPLGDLGAGRGREGGGDEGGGGEKDDAAHGMLPCLSLGGFLDSTTRI